LHESFLNSHAQVKREQEFHVTIRVDSTSDIKPSLIFHELWETVSRILNVVIIVLFVGKNERHVRFDRGTDDGSDQNDSEESGMPKSLQDRLLMLAGQAKKEEQVSFVCN
jgi:hypothetical protein